MTEQLLLAIDCGSQSTKVTIFDSLGNVRASAQRSLRPYDTSTSGHAVHPDDDLWDCLTTTCADAIRRFPGESSQIVAVGLCSIRSCRALLDADGRLVEPVLSWMDERVNRPHDPTDTRVAYVTASSGYLTGRLTGRRLDTGACYQGVWPIDKHSADWATDPAAYEAAGMPRRLLLDLVPPGGLLGAVTADAAAATGIPIGVPVYATANDKAVEALGCGLRTDDAVLLSLGTYIAAMTIGTKAATSATDYWVNFAATPGAYLYESEGIRRGMWTVSWFRDLVADGGPPPLRGQQPRHALEAALENEAVAVPPGCDGLLTLLDWLAPVDKPHRRGALLGFDGSQGRAHIYRSILEGIALTMAGHISRMELSLGRRFRTVIVSGGGSRSDLMMQIVADVLDRPAHRAGWPDAAGLGAAISAAVGHGVHPNWDIATDQMVTAGPIFTPDPPRVAVYRNLAAIYAEATNYTDPLFAWTTGDAR